MLECVEMFVSASAAHVEVVGRGASPLGACVVFGVVTACTVEYSWISPIRTPFPVGQLQFCLGVCVLIKFTCCAGCEMATSYL
mgnify:CR=1 FL=1